jgi:hypothetical protein
MTTEESKPNYTSGYVEEVMQLPTPLTEDQLWGAEKSAAPEPPTPVEVALPPLGRSSRFWSYPLTAEEVDVARSKDHAHLLNLLLAEREEQLLAALTKLAESQKREEEMRAEIKRIKSEL